MIAHSRLGWPAVVSSTRTAIAATTSFLIARQAGLHEAYWAPIITLVIMQSTLGAALKVSGERLPAPSSEHSLAACWRAPSPGPGGSLALESSSSASSVPSFISRTLIVSPGSLWPS